MTGITGMWVRWLLTFYHKVSMINSVCRRYRDLGRRSSSRSHTCTYTPAATITQRVVRPPGAIIQRNENCVKHEQKTRSLARHRIRAVAFILLLVIILCCSRDTHADTIYLHVIGAADVSSCFGRTAR